jgi:hypothetical protein
VIFVSDVTAWGGENKWCLEVYSRLGEHRDGHEMLSTNLVVRERKFDGDEAKI